jgi:hypothetical protein
MDDRVKELASQLKQSQDKASKYSPPMGVLTQVAALPDSAITIAILSSTQIGKVVNGLKSEESKAKWGEETAAMAKSIVKKWKKLAKTTPTPSKPKAPVMQAKKEVRGGKERAKMKQRDNSRSATRRPPLPSQCANLHSLHSTHHTPDPFLPFASHKAARHHRHNHHHPRQV